MNIVHHKPWFCTKKMKQIGNRKNNCPLLSMCKYDISKILSQYIICIAYMTNEGRDIRILGPSWSWSYGSWIYDYLCNQCLSPLTLCVRIPLGVKFVGDLWEVGGFLPGTPVSSTNKTERHDITEILLKVALYTINLT